MRKALFFVSLACLVGCTNDEFLENGTYEGMSVSQETRTLEEAIQIAVDAAKMLDPANTRASAGRAVDRDGISFVLAPSTRASGTSDTLLYVVNYADEKGFAVVSANSNTTGLLAVTEKGTYRVGDSSYAENKGFSDFMDWAKEYARSSSGGITIGGGGIELTEYRTEIDTISKIYLEPKIEVQWGQTGIEGKYAPNGAAGCANTAMAQIMSYFCYPSQIAITYSGASVQSQTLNWQAMKQHKIVHYKQSCTATAEAHEAISQLHRQLGEISKSEYKGEGLLDASTETYMTNTRNAFLTLGYGVSNIMAYNDENLWGALAGEKLLFVSGVREYTEDGETKKAGHAWVVDGKYGFTIRTITWIKPANQGWKVQSERDTSSRYLHINWGWDGSCNGLFYLGSFEPGKGYRYDNPSGNTNSRNYEKENFYFSVYR